MIDSEGILDYSKIEADVEKYVPETNAGFIPISGFKGFEKSCIRGDKELLKEQIGSFLNYDNELAGQIPLTYQIKNIENGNYKLLIKLYSKEDVSEAFLFIGRRRLVWRGSMKKGEIRTFECIENISPIIPRYHTKAADDAGIDITLVGKGVYLSILKYEKWAGRTIYIAGDSTVTDQVGEYPFYPESNYCGWGQMLTAFTGTEYGVSNHAHSGLTTESFRSEGHYEIMYNLVKEGDICLFQFGHNDQKLEELAADKGYRQNLISYINEIRSKKAIPIIVTPLARNTWFGNKDEYNDLLSEYDRVCHELGQEMNVEVIDLHLVSMNFVKELGRVGVKKYFHPDDFTHTNDFGAYLFAKYIYKALSGQNLERLEAEWIPPENPRNSIVGDGGGDFDTILEELTNSVESDSYIKRYEALEIVIKALKFFPTNVYNDLFTDVIGHEVYAGFIQCASQNGILPDYVLKKDKFNPEEYISIKEYLDYFTCGYRSRFGKTLSFENEDTKVSDNSGQVKGFEAISIIKKYLKKGN